MNVDTANRIPPAAPSASDPSASVPPVAGAAPQATVPPAASVNDPRSIADLLGDLRDESVALLRKEGQLARAEMSEKFERASSNLGQVAAGGALLFAGAVVLLIGLGEAFEALLVAMGVEPIVADWVGPVVFGLVITIVGAVLFKKAVDKLSDINPVPERTADTLSDNAQWAQQKVTN